MGTSGGEPRVLLNALKPMLGMVGDIRTPQEVMRVVGMMKDAEKLMSRCIYLNILKATCRQALQSDEKRNTLDKFLMTGGWGILNKWLHEFIKSENFPVLLELIDVLRILPITVELLKQGNTGKLIKQMTKLENADVKKNAGSLIRQWKDMIKGGPNKKPSKENENGKSNSENGIDSQGNIKRSREQDAKGPPEKKLKGSNKQVTDSSGFMNALNAVAPAPIKKKRRNSDSKTTLPLDEILNRQNEKKQKVDNEKVSTPDGSNEVLDPDASTTMQYISPAVEAANQALAADKDNSVVIDEGSLARKKNKKKRNITWARDEDLVQVSYFEVLESERKRFHGESFSQARQHELMLEKQAMRSARRGEDRMMEKIRWSRLIPVDNSAIPNFVSGEKSREKYIQADREKSSLAFIFLTRESLPDTPKEPEFDPDEHTRSQPRTIPHDEDGTIMPKPKQNVSQNSASRSADLEKLNLGNSNDGNKNPNSNNRDVSPAVQNILSQLLRNNQNNEPGPKTAQQTNQIPTLMQQKVTGPGQNIPPNQMGKPMDQQNRLGQFFGEEGRQGNMENNINMMGRGGPMGPRFNGGPANNQNRGGGRGGQGGFLPRNGPPMRPQRWDGPPGPDDWNNFNQNFNDNYNDNFMPGPNGRGGGNFNQQQGFNDNFNRGGFRPRGGMRHENPRNRDWNNDNSNHERRNGNDWPQRGRGRGRGGGNRGNWRKW